MHMKSLIFLYDKEKYLIIKLMCYIINNLIKIMIIKLTFFRIKTKTFRKYQMLKI